jgi:hypothetical protein
MAAPILHHELLSLVTGCDFYQRENSGVTGACRACAIWSRAGSKRAELQTLLTVNRQLFKAYVLRSSSIAGSESLTRFVENDMLAKAPDCGAR